MNVMDKIENKTIDLIQSDIDDLIENAHNEFEYVTEDYENLSLIFSNKVGEYYRVYHTEFGVSKATQVFPKQVLTTLYE